MSNPLDIAIQNNDLESVKLLLENNEIVTGNALNNSAKLGNIEIVKLLLKKGYNKIAKLLIDHNTKKLLAN